MSKDLKPNSLDEMRAHIKLFENFQIQQNISLDEAFPILKQQLAGKMLGLAGKVSRKAQSQALIRQALTAYLKTFVSYMGRINKNWDTITWRNLANFAISQASTQLPMGNLEPSKLSSQEFDALLKDAEYRRQIIQMLPKNMHSMFLSIIPFSGIGTQLDQMISQPFQPKNKTSSSQAIVSAVLAAVIVKLMNKTEGSDDYDPNAPTGSGPGPGPGPTPPGSGPGPTPPGSGPGPTPTGSGPGPTPTGSLLTPALRNQLQQLLQNSNLSPQQIASIMARIP